jgi:hypothetical protein
LRRTHHTFDSILDVLGDGAWHEVEDIGAATRYPGEWVEELRAEGVLEVREGVVTMVRLRADAAEPRPAVVGY